MKERPILFSAPMVRAILADAKTQTRRVVKPQPRDVWGYGVPLPHVDKERRFGIDAKIGPERNAQWIPCPYGAPGDRLWVRETWYCDNTTAPNWNPGKRIEATPDLISEWRESLYYRADAVQTGTCCELIPECACAEYQTKSGRKRSPWRPGIHMPRWASRITLEVTGVRVERLHDITDDDARAEGATADEMHGWLDEVAICRAAKVLRCSYEDPRAWFGALWMEINGAESWDANPWVWVVEFRRIEAQERAA